MITPQEVLDINRSIVIEQYIDRELKKCNFDIELNQFKEILNPDDVTVNSSFINEAELYERKEIC